MAQTTQNTDVANTDEMRRPGAKHTAVRVWPVMVITIVYAAVNGLLLRYGTTNIHSAIALGVAPAIALLLLLIWWFGASRVPWKDRFLGGALFIAAAVAITLGQRTVSLGAMLLASALPFLIYGMLPLVLVTRGLRWSRGRWVLVAGLAVWTGVFSAVRVDSIGGNLFPVVSWRWQASTTEHAGMLTRITTQETAQLPEQPGPGDWTAFRGANRDGRVEGVRFSTEWSTPPREVWRRDIGSAWSGFILVGGYLFTQEQRGEEELVTCYHADTGEPVWSNGIKEKFEDGMGLGPRATPTYSGGRLYTQGGTGIMQCLDAATGETLWKRDLRKDALTEVPEWGFSASPLVVEGLVIVFTAGEEGKGVIAYDCSTGEPAWMSGHGDSGYCSPHLGVLCGTPQVLMVSNFGIESLDPAGGTRLWEHKWDIQTNPRCTQPIVLNGDSVMFGATGVSGSRLLRTEYASGQWQVAEKWTTRKFRPYFNDGAVLHQHYYGFDGERVACLDVMTGDRVWAGERLSGQMLLLVDMEMLLVLSEAGEVVLIPATPQAYEVKARFKAIEGKTWNHPLVGGGRLFVRNAREAVCYEIAL